MPNLTTLIRWTPPSFPPGYCFTDFNRLFLDAAALGSFTLNTDVGNSFFNFGDTVPDAANRIFPWLRTVGGYPDDWYVFVGGAWYSEYKRAPAEGVGSFGVRWAYTGTEASLLTFDGGEATPIGVGSGPFWEVDHDFDGRVPVCPGNLPSGASVALGDSAGNDVITIGSGNIPPHVHAITIGQSGGGNSDIIAPDQAGSFRVGGGGTMQYLSTWSSPYVGYTRESGGSSGTPDPLNNMQPYVGAFWIKRTARVYRRVNA